MPFEYERNFFSYLENLKAQMKVTPLRLDGGIGGYIGNLPQGKVAYDLVEREDWYELPLSGLSLVDNMNKIRYRVATLEADPGGVALYKDGVLFRNSVTQINFVGAEVSLLYPDLPASNACTITVSGGVTGSGVVSGGGLNWDATLSGWGSTDVDISGFTGNHITQTLGVVRPIKITSIDIYIMESGLYQIGFVPFGTSEAGRSIYTKLLADNLAVPGNSIFHVDLEEPYGLSTGSQYLKVTNKTAAVGWATNNSTLVWEKVNDVFIYGAFSYSTINTSSASFLPIRFSGYAGDLV